MKSELEAVTRAALALKMGQRGQALGIVLDEIVNSEQPRDKAKKLVEAGVVLLGKYLEAK